MTIISKLLQPRKASVPISVTEEGIEMLLRSVQFSKANILIFDTVYDALSYSTVDGIEILPAFSVK